MPSFGVGDLARQFHLNQSSGRLKTDVQRLTEELASGKKSKVGALASGDTAHVAGLHRSLNLLRTFSGAVAESGLFVDTMQTALEALQSETANASPAFLAAGSSAHTAQLAAISQDAKVRFDGMISTLNTRSTDQAVFAGRATDQPAMADSEVILDALRTAIAGETTAAGIETVLTDWFMTPGGGFDTVAYLGSDEPPGPFPLGTNDRAEPEVTAASDPIRRSLLGFAMAAMIQEDPLAGSVTERAKLATSAGELLLSNETKLAELRAEVGTIQARVEEARVKTATEALSVEAALSNMTSSDPYRATTELQGALAQLESLHTLTARLSRLSLTEFLR